DVCAWDRAAGGGVAQYGVWAGERYGVAAAIADADYAVEQSARDGAVVGEGGVGAVPEQVDGAWRLAARLEHARGGGRGLRGDQRRGCGGAELFANVAREQRGIGGVDRLGGLGGHYAPQ